MRMALRLLVVVLSGTIGWLALPEEMRERVEPRVRAVTFTVTNTNDSGDGSLRKAMQDAIDLCNPPLSNRVVFNIPAGGLKTIDLLSQLPTITCPMILDGTTQPGYAGAPLIELNGADTGSFAAGFDSMAPVTIKGFVINRFTGGNASGVYLGGGSDGSSIIGNYIGTDPTGNFRRPNALGIIIFSSNNSVGGMTAAERNVISGQDAYGILNAGNQNVILGNYIGTNAAGNASLGNGNTAIVLEGSNTTIGGLVPGARNILSGNGTGIVMGDQVTGSLIQGNFIGTDVTGTLDFGNTFSGIEIHGFANTIGGSSPEARNIISGNGGNGIAFGFSSMGNVVQGNYIGTDVTGTLAIGNAGSGVYIAGDGSNQIGGPTPAARNVISGNFGQGIGIASVQNVIQGNFIGTDAGGIAVLGNGQQGILVSSGSNTIGLDGGGAGAGNTIAYNGGSGVNVDGSSSIRNRISGNSIFGNGAGLSPELGVDLSPPLGVNPNAPGAHIGANNLQNFPVLSSATSSGSTTTILGTFNSGVGTSFRIEFFGNTKCDTLGNGEGQTFIGVTNVNTDGGGNATINMSLPVVLFGGQSLTATATDVNGNTSEFSACLQVTGPSPTLQVNSITPQAGRVSGGQPVTLTGDLAGLSTVTMGGEAASWFYPNGPGDFSTITVTTPPHSVGAADLVLTPVSGTTLTRPHAFAYLPVALTDDVVVAGQTTVKAQHLIELRQAVEALRAVAGLGSAPWTDPALAAGGAIKAAHIMDLRTLLDDAAGRLGYPTSAYTDPSLSAGFAILRIHLEELRQRVRAIAQGPG